MKDVIHANRVARQAAMSEELVVARDIRLARYRGFQTSFYRDASKNHWTYIQRGKAKRIPAHFAR